MMRENAALAIMVVFILFISGCFDQGDQASKKERVVTLTTEQTTGFCSNPEVGGESTATYLFEISEPHQVVIYGVRLTWTDDHAGEDSEDYYDTFTLDIKAGNETESFTTDEETITLILGEENIDLSKIEIDIESETMSMDIIREDFKSLESKCEITVTISDCGSYPLIRPDGILREDDPGNDWELYMEAWVVDYVKS